MESKEQKVSYTVTITKTEYDVPYVSKQWQKVVDEVDDKHDELYRYVTTDSTKDVDTQIFIQTLDQLDVGSVVIALNQK